MSAALSATADSTAGRSSHRRNSRSRPKRSATSATSSYSNPRRWPSESTKSMGGDAKSQATVSVPGSTVDRSRSMFRLAKGPWSAAHPHRRVPARMTSTHRAVRGVGRLWPCLTGSPNGKTASPNKPVLSKLFETK